MAKNPKLEASPEVIEEVATDVVAPQDTPEITEEVTEVAEVVVTSAKVTKVGKMIIEDF